MGISLRRKAPPGIFTYGIYVGPHGAETLALTAPDSYFDLPATNGTDYWIYIVPVAPDGSQGDPSAEYHVQPHAGGAPAPTGVTATPGDGFVDLAWTPNQTGPKFTIVETGPTSTGPWKWLVSAPPGAWRDIYVTDGTQICYRIHDFDGNRDGASAAPLCTTPVAGTPPAPAQPNVVAGNASATIVWTPPLGQQTANIYRASSASGPFTKIASGITGSWYVDSTAPNDQWSCYAVSATSAAEGPQSAPICVWPWSGALSAPFIVAEQKFVGVWTSSIFRPASLSFNVLPGDVIIAIATGYQAGAFPTDSTWATFTEINSISVPVVPVLSKSGYQIVRIAGTHTFTPPALGSCCDGVIYMMVVRGLNTNANPFVADIGTAIAHSSTFVHGNFAANPPVRGMASGTASAKVGAGDFVTFVGSFDNGEDYGQELFWGPEGWTYLDSEVDGYMVAMSGLYSMISPSNQTVAPTLSGDDIGLEPFAGQIFSMAALNIVPPPVNHAPATSNASVTTPGNTAYTFKQADFPFSDPDDHPPNNLQALLILSLPTTGRLELRGQAIPIGTHIDMADIGTLSYIPAAGQTGQDSFQFELQDDGGTALGGTDISSPATMTINKREGQTLP